MGGARRPLPGAGCAARGRAARPNCPLCVTHVGPTNHSGRAPARGGETAPQAKAGGVKAQLRDQVSPWRAEVGPHRPSVWP